MIADSKKKGESTNEQQKAESNQFSIYDYFKKTPTMFIAVISACVAFITFVARIATVNNMRNILSFWNFDLSYLNYDNNSLFLYAITTFVYFLIFGLGIAWLNACYKPLLQQKYCLFENKQLVKRLKKEKEKSNKTDYLKIEAVIQEKESLIEKNNNRYLKVFAFTFVIALMLLFLAVYVHLSVISNSEGKKYWLKFAIVFFVQFFFQLHFLSMFYDSCYAKKKIIKKYQTESVDNLINSTTMCEEYNHPLFIIKNRGIKPFFDNKTIIGILILTFAYCIIICILNVPISKWRTWKEDTYQITTLDSTTYVVILHDNSHYYLEKAEIIKSNELFTDEKNKTIGTRKKTTLKVYTNEQRVITSNDFNYYQRTFDDVVKIEQNNKK